MTIPTTARRLLAAAALAAAVPALAYVPSAGAILRRAAEKRGSLTLSSLDVAGTLELEGDAGARLAQAMGVPPSSDGRLSVPARFLLRVPGRCRLELARPGVPDAERPFLVVRDGRLTGRGLDGIPALAALARAACGLVAIPASADADRALAAALTRRGVPLDATSLGRLEGRLTFVIGGTGADGKPGAAFDKETAQPLRLVATEGGTLLDTRLLGWGSPEGGDWFPKTVEVYAGEQLQARFATSKASANVKLPDALF